MASLMDCREASQRKSMIWARPPGRITAVNEAAHWATQALSLGRVALAEFLNPGGLEQVPVGSSAAVVDLVAGDHEICPDRSGVRKHATTEIVRDFIICDQHVCVWVRDFDPVGLT